MAFILPARRPLRQPDPRPSPSTGATAPPAAPAGTGSRTGGAERSQPFGERAAPGIQVAQRDPHRAPLL